MNMAKEDGDIAEADDPFGMLQQGRKIQSIDNMNGAVAAAGAEDSIDGGIVQHLLEVGEPFGIGAAEGEVFFADSVADLDMEAPAFYLLDSGLDLFQGDIPGGTGDTDQIARPKVGRDKEDGTRRRLSGEADRIRMVVSSAGGKGRSNYSHAQYGRKKFFSIHLYICINIASAKNI
jgi:hypothetical protein